MHNKTLLLYHLVFPLKYRKSVITDEVGEGLKQICLDISDRYEVHFIEIEFEPDHVHFLVQSVLNLFDFKDDQYTEKYYSKRIIQEFYRDQSDVMGREF